MHKLGIAAGAVIFAVYAALPPIVRQVIHHAVVSVGILLVVKLYEITATTIKQI